MEIQAQIKKAEAFYASAFFATTLTSISTNYQHL
jgi:hypothetical protein